MAKFRVGRDTPQRTARTTAGRATVGLEGRITATPETIAALRQIPRVDLPDRQPL
jgi:hypothetical protein